METAPNVRAGVRKMANLAPNARVQASVHLVMARAVGAPRLAETKWNFVHQKTLFVNDGIYLLTDKEGISH